MAFRQGVQWPVLPSSRYRHQKMRVPEWSSASQGLKAHRQRLEYATLVDQQAPIFCSRFLGIAGASRNGIRSSLLESYIDSSTASLASCEASLSPDFCTARHSGNTALRT